MKISSNDWAIKYLQDRGIEVILNFNIDHVNHWVIKWQCEQVGTMYDDEVYLAQHMPSLLDGNYRSTSKSCIKFTESRAEEKLLTAIDKLKYSLKEYEKEKRKQRVKRVQEYFRVKEYLNQRDKANSLTETMESQSLKECIS